MMETAASAPQATEIKTDFEVDVPLLLKDPLQALAPLLKKVRGWGEATLETLKVSQLSGAMTNLIYRCRYQHGDEKLFALARVFGNIPDDLFSRDYEQMIFRTVARAGMGPKLLVSFANGRIEEFYVACNCLSAEQMAEVEVSRALAAAMSSFHFASLLHLPPEEATDPQVWNRLRGWLRFTGELYGTEGMKEHGLENTLTEVEALEAKLKAEHPSWLAFCHNDLQCGNVMLDATSLARIGSGPGADNAMQDVSQFTVDEGDEEGGSGDLGQAIAEVDGGSPRRGGSPRTGAAAFFLGGASSGGLSAAGSVPKSLGNSVALQEEDTRDAKGRTLLPRSSSAEWVAAPITAIKLIDYEYAGINCVAYDIANHWCEYAADYDTAQPHVLDFNKMPGPERQVDFVDAYVASLAEVHQRLAAKPNGLETVTNKLNRAQMSAGLRDEKPLPEQAARALTQGGGALDALSRKLQAATRAYIPVSHLLWGLWGLIQAKSSEIDFDYVAYATQRLGEWNRLLAEHAPEVVAS
mmetsp:Transcript_15344/g.46336  ORF Transcript_15344/g.46336 Transcript_15344/m.46336 type:complete len:524 (-) Transcript_15344:642-2213(-)|eukprot:CAMPEP_0206151652 /NCGR_PEP_ID=MMETSP1473-20131121/38928_1 /ASSEMBLY_ACC=CAM_ASM_001109 /TAXON_ID=1461547 /ORGANISM="Stichococcus sp, Strain RCC1054" /LENGTH=523 /DNA_ID=CAMNT_0053549199 /DNA_START=397 /DNA_END=1968 /DNA_ORIENTATION=+